MTPPETGTKFRSYVPDKTEMREFTTRAVLLGLVMTVVLGAANPFPGLGARLAHRRHLPGGGHWHGHPAADEGFHSRREHGPNHRLHRRIGGSGRGVYHSRL